MDGHWQMRLLLLGIILWLFALVAFSTTIVNTASQPVNMRVVGAMAAATPTGTPAAASPTPTPTATATASAFDPTSIAGMKGWWKVDALTPVSDGTIVTAWPDSSGNANTASSWASGAGAFYYSNVLRLARAMKEEGASKPGDEGPVQLLVGKPVLRFNLGGSNAFAIATPFAMSSGWTVFSVMRAQGLSSDMCSLGDGATNANAAGLSNGESYYVGQGQFYQGGAAGDLDWHVLSSTSSPSLYVDGVSQTLTTVGGPIGVGTFTTIGHRAPANYSSGEVAEILLYQGVLSTTDRQNVENYLKTKYALPPPVPVTIAGLTLWLRADASGNLGPVDGTVVPYWHDASGKKNDLTGSATWKTPVVNGKPAMRFTIGNTFGNNITALLPLATTQYTVFAVASAASTSASGHTILNLGSDPLILRRDGADFSLYHLGPSYALATEVGGVVAGAWNVLSGDWDGTNIHLWRNRILKATTAAPAPAGAPGPGINVAQDTASTQPWDGDIAEILLYQGALSSTDRAAVENYLKAKYATP
jgi:hypothetical protein